MRRCLWPTSRTPNLQGANLYGANLQRAKLQKADLQRANLLGAKLLWADLRAVNLEKAKLEAADLRGASDLTPTIVQSAKGWDMAFYDPSFLPDLGLPSDHNTRVLKELGMKAPSE